MVDPNKLFNIDVSIIGENKKIIKSKVSNKNKIVIDASVSFISNLNDVDDYN
jgi:hypothetical protein